MLYYPPSESFWFCSVIWIFRFCLLAAYFRITRFMSCCFYLYPDTFIITGESDIVKDEGFKFYEKLSEFNTNSKYLNVEFLEHGFIDFTDDSIKEEIYNKIDEFL